VLYAARRIVGVNALLMQGHLQHIAVAVDTELLTHTTSAASL